MYNSQYYTCEQIDQRLLQGYLDDYNSETGQNLTKAQFLTKLRSAIDNFINEGGVRDLIEGYIYNGFLYGGYATPTGTPQLPSRDINASPMFFIATSPGTYTNYGNVVIAKAGLHIILLDTDTWSLNQNILEIEQEFGNSPLKLLSQKAINDGVRGLIEHGYFHNKFTFGGYAIPTGTPSLTSEDKIPLFFIATRPGTYTNYGGITIAKAGLHVILWDTSTWSVESNILEIEQEFGNSTYKLISQQVITDGLQHLGEDANLLTNILATEVSDNSLITPSAYKKGKIYKVDLGDQGPNFSKFVGCYQYYIAKVDGAAGDSLEDTSKFETTYSSSEALNKVIGYIKIDNDNIHTQVGYYECDTAGATAAKTIAVANYALFAGGALKVKFVNKNTANNATLNINSNGAKALYYQGERASATNSWDDNEVVEIYYDGTSYYANNIKGGSGSGVYDVSKEHPTSGPNGDGKFTLEYILNSNNVNELIPVNKRYPGMSIQFVSTSDNKYVQYRLTADEWSPDTEDWAIADEGVYVDNPEFVYVKTDKEGKILWAIKIDGGIYYGAGCPQQVKDYIEEKISSLSLDEYEDIVAFLSDYLGSDTTLKVMIDGINVQIATKVDKVEGKSLIDADYASSQSAIDNLEYIEVKTDSEGKLLAGRTNDGAAFENVGFSTPKISIDGHKVENIEDPEGRTEILTDSEGKIISYRDNNGVKHEVVGMEIDSASINHLNLTNIGMTEFQQALIDTGFNPKMPIDWSGVKELHLPIPRTCAKVNLIVPSLPTTKGSDYEGYVEYIDFDGNYFKKKMVLNPQGDSSLTYIEKNYTLDIDDKSKIQFSNWVSQDSFHLKAYYIDVFRGINNVCYKWTNKIIEYLGCRANRVLNNTSSVTTGNGTGTFTTDFGSSALCQPDGFPVEVYHNGIYHGLYALNLKKNRDNYQMKKDNYTQALLDGVINGSTFFGGNIDWTQFELRNPKKLILEDGTTEYDGDNPAEIIGTDSPNYDRSNTDQVNTATTKAMIEEVANCIATISFMPISTPQEIQTVKTLFESHYDIEMIKCYFILSNVIYHYDGFSKNWIWTIYNGMAAPTFYDMDTVFGRIWYGSGMWGNNTTTHIIGTDEYDLQAHSGPSTIIANLYKDELDAMYKDLRDNGYISVPAIMSQIYEWIGAQTLEAIQRNLKKWTAIPSYRADGGSYPPPLSYSAEHQTEGMYDCPVRVEKWLTARLTRLDNYFNYTSN